MKYFANTTPTLYAAYSPTSLPSNKVFTLKEWWSLLIRIWGTIAGIKRNSEFQVKCRLVHSVKKKRFFKNSFYFIAPFLPADYFFTVETNQQKLNCCSYDRTTCVTLISCSHRCTCPYTPVHPVTVFMGTRHAARRKIQRMWQQESLQLNQLDCIKYCTHKTC